MLQPFDDFFVSSRACPALDVVPDGKPLPPEGDFIRCRILVAKIVTPAIGITLQSAALIGGEPAHEEFALISVHNRRIFPVSCHEGGRLLFLGGKEAHIHGVYGMAVNGVEGE